MTALNDRFWAKVLFSQFIKHYRKMDDTEIVADIKQSMDDLEDLNEEGCSFGAKMVRWSMERVEQYPMARENGKKGGRPRKNVTTALPEESKEENEALDAYKGESNTGSTPPVVRPESGTFNADAPHREAGDESATVCDDMPRVGQNEAPAHGFSGGRTAQGTMSRSPEAAAQSGKDYDQYAYQASTNGPRQAEARQSQRAGGNSVRRVAKVSTPPVRSAGPMPKDVQEVYDYADADGLDTADAYECWHVTVNERNGLTADGREIKNWKAYVKQWCRTRKSKREENGHGNKKD